ncbi:MAG TPA: DHH family phosphoesterase [Candidatus Nanoarchaeia archaeon]|nr:DHH family phosphoesterase [Candidatus Nanoarchaeia archaeon]
MALIKRLNELRELLVSAENPLFFFDDDPDGLGAYLLLRKKAGKGHGIALKKGPGLESMILRKIMELNPDRVFFLDVAVIEQDLLDKIRVPVAWLDHHPLVKREKVHYFNPRADDPKDTRCTTYWAYQVAEQKENEWIAAVGIISDWQIPEFLDKFEFKDLVGKPKAPGEAYFESEYGKLVKVFAFLLKGRTSDVKKNINILLKIESPLEILNQTTSRGKFLWKYFEQFDKEYSRIYKKASATEEDDGILLFTYPSNEETSFTSLLSNELMHKKDASVVIVARIKEDMMLMSLRSKKVPILPLLQKALKEVRGYGGGHDYSCGAGVNKDDLPTLLRIIREGLNKK